MAAANRCLEALRVIGSLWPTLLAARRPGVSSPGSAGPPGIEQARVLRQERAEAGTTGGDVRALVAPCDLAVVMAIDDVERMLAVAHDQLLAAQDLPRTCSRCRHPLTVHSRAAVDRGRCTTCRRCVGFRLVRVAAPAPSWRQLLVDVRAAEAVEFRLSTARAKVESTLNLIDSGLLITAMCPWCQGQSEAMPGGSYTLRAFIPGVVNETYVMCLNPTCDPPSAACGHRSHGHPFWPYEELDWLSQRLDVVDFRRRRRPPERGAVAADRLG